MSCNKFEEFGLLYFYKELDDRGRAEFERHLVVCEFCRAALKELEEITELYESLPEYEPSPDAVRNVLESAKMQAQKKPVFAWLSIFQKWGSSHWRLPRPVPALVSRAVWIGSGIGVAIILVFLFRFFPHEPASYLAWDYNIDNEIEVIDAGLYDLRRGTVILGVFGVEEKIKGVKEDINTLEKAIKSW